MFERSLDDNHFGQVLTELLTWLLRIRFLPNRSSCRLVEGIGRLRRFVRRTTTSDLLELLGDIVTPWSVSGRARDLNTAEVDV